MTHVVNVEREASRRPGAWSTSSEEGWSLVEPMTWGLMMAALATLLPLYDPDLPMHLALGEWIVQNRSVPLVEPFAWTRQGEPFFAYSWLPESVFYLVHRAAGPAALRLLQGALIGGVFVCTAIAGRMMGWRSGTAFLTASFAVLVAALVTPSLRPQIVLLIVVPLIWGWVHRIAHGLPVSSAAPWLVLLAALAGNSHLFFPITLAPVALLAVQTPLPQRRIATAGVCIVGGWLLTPYMLHLPALLATNLGSNAIMEWPSAISELQPGFVAVARLEHVIVVPALLLAALPWGTAGTRWSVRLRWLAAVYWLVGLIAFGYAIRLLMLWWLLVLPFAGLVIQDGTASEEDRVPRMGFRVIGYGALLVLLALSARRAAHDWVREGDVDTRRLATQAARPAEPLAAWLEDRTVDSVSGRIFTVFNYGSYLVWRLPSLSSSIDGRGVFPDSVARAEVLVPADIDSTVLGPWSSADLAIVPLNRRVAAVLDTATGWRRVAQVDPMADKHEGAALWVRESWWARHATVPLPPTPDVVSPEVTRPARAGEGR